MTGMQILETLLILTGCTLLLCAIAFIGGLSWAVFKLARKAYKKAMKDGLV